MDEGTAASSQNTGRQNNIVERVREGTNAQLSRQKDRATDGLGSIAQAVRQSTQPLREQQHDTIARYIEQAADQLDKVSARLKQKNVGELVEDAQRFARRQPALFIGAAFTAGVVGARFFKSSAERTTAANEAGEYGGARTRTAEVR
jgi:hypothetical protein